MRSASRPVALSSNGPLNTIDTSLFGAMPFRTVVWTTPAGGLTPRSRHVSRAVGGRQAREVGFDQRAHRLEREAADEDEREVAGVGEARLVERERLVEIPFRHRFRRLGLPPWMVAAQRRVERLVEDGRPGSPIWLASSASACAFIAANAVGSARGCVNRRYSSWNIVSRSRGALPPRMPSRISVMNGRTASALRGEQLVERPRRQSCRRRLPVSRRRPRGRRGSLRRSRAMFRPARWP